MSLNEFFENNVVIINVLIAAKVKRSFRFDNQNSDVPTDNCSQCLNIITDLQSQMQCQTDYNIQVGIIAVPISFVGRYLNSIPNDYIIIVCRISGLSYYYTKHIILCRGVIVLVTFH